VHGALTGLDLTGRAVAVRHADGTESREPFDVLVISTGVSNGFWRRAELESASEVDAGIQDAHQQLADASSVVVVGGGSAAVSAAANVARVWPDKRIDLYFPGERALPTHHGRVWAKVLGQLEAAGVGVHPGHRAVLPPEFTGERITGEPVKWSTRQPPAEADAVLWAIGRVRPNTAWLPAELLDKDGFVRAQPDLRVPGTEGIFTIGDVAATDPLRSTARNFTHTLLASNIRAHLDGRPLKTFRAPKRRWGSVLGPQPDGLTVFAPDGRGYRIPGWAADSLMQPLIVNRGLYRGVRGWRRRPR
jgi:NADH dehydrogenase FAD-containing subunit